MNTMVGTALELTENFSRPDEFRPAPPTTPPPAPEAPQAPRPPASAGFEIGAWAAVQEATPDTATNPEALFPVAPLRSGPVSLDEGITAYKKGDYEEALRHFVTLAKEVNATALFWLAAMYDQGRGVSQDNARAAEYYRFAAELGHAGAQYIYAALCADGLGIPQNLTTAAAWYRRAADQGHAEAQYKLGLMYYTGGHLTQSYVRAAEWFARAAEQGHPLAQFTYATMCELGRGVVEDKLAAFQWFAVSAARQTDPIYRERASRSRDRLAPRLTPQKKTEADRRIAAWTPRLDGAIPAGRH